jgi:hypothetical protein
MWHLLHKNFMHATIRKLFTKNVITYDSNLHGIKK